MLCMLSFIGLRMPAHAQSNESKNLFESVDLELSIPSIFEKVENQSALLALRHKIKGYPTFNIVLATGAWPYIKQNYSFQGQKLVDEYRLVGLKNTELKEIREIQIDSQPALYAKLKYTIADTSYQSEVWLISLLEKHIILTAVYRNEAEEISQNEIQNLIKTLKIKDPSLKGNDTKTSSNFISLKLKIIIGLSILLILGLSLYRYRQKL